MDGIGSTVGMRVPAYRMGLSLPIGSPPIKLDRIEFSGTGPEVIRQELRCIGTDQSCRKKIIAVVFLRHGLCYGFSDDPLLSVR